VNWIKQHNSSILRWLFLVSVMCLAVAPSLPLVITSLGSPSNKPFWTDAFARSTQSSLWMGLGVTGVSLVVGLPLGLLVSLYRFPARRALILFQALPLLLPSFLLCIGWSNLASAKWLPWLPTPNGFSSCVLVLGCQAIPLTFFATWAACRNLTASQIDAARLHGGEHSVLKQSALACAPVTMLAALLGGILSLSDPGAPLIFGCRSAAVEILTSFSALFDYELAARQCLALAGLILVLTAPVLLFGLRFLSSAVLTRQTRPAVPYRHKTFSRVAFFGLLILLAVGVVVPTIGLCLPAAQNPMVERAMAKASDTAGTTMLFTGGAACIAVVLATVIAMIASSDYRVRLIVLAVLLSLLAMPPALAAIGVVQVATQAPPQLDWLLRSQFTVMLVLGLRFLPVATVAMMRAMGSLSPTWTEAARLHGVSSPRFVVRVILPNVAPAIIVSLLLVIVLAAADITSTHLLQPPGTQSLPVAIFTVMANSPEGLVASLCLLYLLAVVLVLSVCSQLPRLWSRSPA
jgi:iron(III) transport system permease protein